MDYRKRALIIATDNYQDPALEALNATVRDAERLGRVLRDPDVGGFEVQILANQPHFLIMEAIEGFFTDKKPDDLLLLHIACHGVTTDDGDLHFAAYNTRSKRLASTAISDDFIAKQTSRTRAQRVILVLDCCFSGRFPRAVRARGNLPAVDLKARFSGYGRAILSSCDTYQRAFEGRSVTHLSSDEPSAYFTGALIEGLESGEADLNGDGIIALQELFNYAQERVADMSSAQTPVMWIEFREGRDLQVAKRRRSLKHLPPIVKNRLQREDLSRQAIRELVLGRTTHPFEEGISYLYVIGDGDDEDTVTQSFVTRALPDPASNAGVYWRTTKLRSTDDPARAALANGRVRVEAVMDDGTELRYCQINSEDDMNEKSSLEFGIFFPIPIAPGQELTWHVRAYWPGFNHNVRSRGNDRHVLTLNSPRAFVEFKVNLPSYATGSRFELPPPNGRVVNTDNTVMHWESDRPAPPGAYAWQIVVDLPRREDNA
jgi:Caspase domain